MKTPKTHWNQILTQIKHNYLLILTSLLIIFFYFYGLGGDMFNADQHFWFLRTQNFISEVQKGHFAETFQNPKPGVTIMWLSGISLESFLQLYTKIFHFRPLIYTQDTFKYVDFAVKFPLVVVTLISLAVFYFLVKKILGKDIALLSLILLAFQPFFIGISRLFHGDGTLSAFMLMASLTLLYALYRPSHRLIAVSGVLAGLAFLSKSQAVFLIPFFFLTTTIDYIFQKRPLKWYLKSTTLWLLALVGTTILLFPAMWVAPITTIKNILFEGVYVANYGRNGGDGQNLMYLTGIPRMISFINIGAFLIGIYVLIKDFKTYSLNKKLFIVNIGVFLFFYTFQMCLVYQKSLRYLAPNFAYISIIGAMGLSKIKYKWLIHLTLLLSVINLVYYFPNYYALSEGANWGSMANTAANYLNQKPNPTDLRVVVLPKEHTFRPFFKGKAYGINETIPNNWKIDYVVVGNDSTLPKEYSSCMPEKTIYFRYKLFWTIYTCTL